MDRYTGFEVNLLCGAGGAEISGVDASRPIGAEVVTELRRALAAHCVIFLRDQDLTPDQQKTVARHFGPLASTPFIKPLEGHPEMMRIVREPQESKKLNFGGRWHSDMTFAPEPVLGTCLCISAGPGAWINRRLLGSRIAVWFGLISYPLYLWHWPLLAYARVLENGSDPARVVRIAAVVAAIGLAWITYRYVELRLRRSGFGHHGFG